VRFLFSCFQVTAQKFEIANDMFWKDGQPFQIIGGDLHYFRVLPEVFLYICQESAPYNFFFVQEGYLN
jgi:hypothetical protein